LKGIATRKGSPKRPEKRGGKKKKGKQGIEVYGETKFPDKNRGGKMIQKKGENKGFEGDCQKRKTFQGKGRKWDLNKGGKNQKK